MTGAVDGDMDLDAELFSIHGQVRAEIAGLPAAGAEAWVTSKGIVACLDFVGVHPGAGYKWGGSPEIFWGTPGTAAAELMLGGLLRCRERTPVHQSVMGSTSGQNR